MSMARGFRFYTIALVMILTQSAYTSTDASDPMRYREVEMRNGWKQIFPGGETTCARGEEFSFFYREENSDELVIDFVGGGACWSYLTCKKETAHFVDSVEHIKRRIAEGKLHGIYDHNNELNPIKNWSHVVIPYCTGDIHWGDSVHTYDGGVAPFTIFHKGAVNAKSVLDWTFLHHRPQKIFVTGTSAGGYASLYWLPYIKEHAQNASITQFSDSAAGIVMKDGFFKAVTIWNGEKHAPTWIPGIDPRSVNWKDLSIVDMYIEIGRYYPKTTFSQFNTRFDLIQMAFYTLMGGIIPFEWIEKAERSFEQISEEVPNFQYFQSAGDFHTILPKDSLYSLTANNVKLVDWIQNMLDHTDIRDVVCTNCEAPISLRVE